MKKYRRSKKLSFFQTQLLAWYKDYGRRFSWRQPSCSLFTQVLAEILLQRTPAGRVDSVLPLLTQKFRTWQAIALASEYDLQVHLKTLGLWRRRVSALRKFAAEMHRRNGSFPRDRKELESLPAVGQYIANAILLLAHSERQPLLDVNMARVLERFFGPRQFVDIRYDQYLQQLSRVVLWGVDAKLMNWAILDFAVALCRNNRPLCEQCPLKSRCSYYEAQQPQCAS